MNIQKVNSISTDKILEKKISEEVNSEYWQEIIEIDSKNILKILNRITDFPRMEVLLKVQYKNYTLNVNIPFKELNISSSQLELLKERVYRTKIVEYLIRQQFEYYNGELAAIEKHNKENIEIEKLQNELIYIKTTKNNVMLRGIKQEMIFVEDGIIFFGEKAAVNLNNFISYEFVDDKENE